MSRTFIFDVTALNAEDLARAAREVSRGALAVLPTDTVYGIGTGACCESAIARIYQIKNRPASCPLQLLVAGEKQARKIAVFSPGAQALAARYWPGGLTLVLPPTHRGERLRYGFAGLGIRVAATAFLQRFLTCLGGPLACTSANAHGQPVITREEDLVQLFEGKADFIFKGGTLSALASSVVDLTARPRLLREGSIPRQELEETLGETFVNGEEKI